MDWREDFLGYIEEVCMPMVAELKRAAHWPKEIGDLAGTPEEKRLAKNVYSALRKLVKETEAKQIVNNVGTKNPYAACRRLHFERGPQIATVEAAAMNKLLNPQAGADLQEAPREVAHVGGAREEVH